jgi:Ca-activated chloride channel family protein
LTFSEPIYLLLLIPAFAWLFFVARRMHGMAKARRRLAVGLRAVLLILMVLALAGLQTVRSNKGVTTLYVLDMSASMGAPAADAARQFIGKSLEALGPNDRAGLIAFGKEPVIDVNTGSLRTLGKVYSNPDSSATDLASAIRLASASFGEGTARRMVLLTDGNETTGDALQAANVAATDGVQVDYVKPGEAAQDGVDVVLNDLVLPAEVTRGEPFEARVIAEATAPASGTIHVDRDGVPVAQIPVHLTKGTNSLVVSQSLPQPGFYRYRAVLDVDGGDRDPRNNAGMGFVSVRGRPRVLLLEGVPGSADALAKALKLYDLDVTRSGAEGLPTRPEDLQAYDSVLYSDFPAQMQTDRQMEQVASAVRESGVGYGMIGGENSFLPGGYYETPIADMLPVDMNVRQRKVFPSTTIVIVCDTSGSMGMIEDGQPKVKIAATAAAATVRMMSPNDYVGVAGSTDMIEFVAPIQPATDKERIAAQCGTLDVGGGGIYIRPSLEFAEKNLRGQNTKVKHMILLADGNDSDEQEGALDLARRMVGEGMTITVVAIGDGKDVPFLKALAATGRGAFYLALHAKQLQRLFTRDASMMSRSAIEEGTFLPKVDPGDEVLRGLDLHSMPPLHAYCLTSDRPLSRIPMRTGKDDPLLAYWQYGLGTSMAFTSDAQPKWARPWMGWGDFGAFWAQAVRGTLRRASNNHLQVTGRREGGKGVAEIEAFDPSGNPLNNLGAHVRVLGPDGTAHEVPITQQGPGRYRGEFDATKTGAYVLTVAEQSGTGAPRVTRSGFAIAYPPEYQAVRPNTPLLVQIAQATGGQALATPVSAFRPAVRTGQSIHDLWPDLLLAAAIVFLLDIAVRRLVLPLARMWALFVSFVSRPFRRTHTVAAPQVESIARLQQAKRGTGAGQTAEPGATITSAPSEQAPRGAPAAKPPAAPAQGTAPLSTAQRLLDAKKSREEKK